jgi:phosphoglycolate phosphatase-like HAD superfamily hydrolase
VPPGLVPGYVDIIMGRAAGHRTCAVTWGNQSPDRLARQQPDHIVDAPEQLAPTLLLR